jgi:hypothetical protein
MLFHTKVDISRNKSLTPEGFLLCRNVPIARTGDQAYYEGEVPISPDPANPYGPITITRDEAEVFHPDAIASFEGKPITMHHPEDAVTPENWSELSKGHAQNVRRGSGLETDCLIADFLIMEKQTIDDVQSGKIKEVSCGYDAAYVETGPGRGKQTEIRGNHIALVERGRCGVTCTIHDAEYPKKTCSECGGKTQMKPEYWDKNPQWKCECGHINKTTKDEKGGTMKGLFSKMFKSLTSDEQKQLGIKVEDASLTVDQRLDRMEASISGLVKMIKDAAEEEESEEEKKKKAAKDKKGKDAAFEGKETEEEEKKEKGTEDEEEDKPFKAKDAAPVMQEVLYRSSILAPDLSRPTMDSVGKMTKKTFDEACCLIKRKSLDAAYRTEEGRSAIKPFTKDSDFFTADCKSVDMAFIGASEIMKASGTKDKAQFKVADFFKGGISPADINKANAAYWAGKGGK